MRLKVGLVFMQVFKRICNRGAAVVFDRWRSTIVGFCFFFLIFVLTKSNLRKFYVGARESHVGQVMKYLPIFIVRS